MGIIFSLEILMFPCFSSIIEISFSEVIFITIIYKQKSLLLIVSKADFLSISKYCLKKLRSF